MYKKFSLLSDNEDFYEPVSTRKTYFQHTLNEKNESVEFLNLCVFTKK